MKKLTLMNMSVALFAVLMLAIPARAQNFSNGGFESGDTSGWTQGGGYWYGGWPMNPSTYLPGGANYDPSGTAITVVSPSIDPYSGLKMVYNGNYSARVNDDNNNYSVSVLSQTVHNYTDPKIYFAWAAVLEGSHGLTDSDNFTLQLTDDTKGTDLYDVSYNSASAAGTSLFNDTYTWWSGDVFWTPWQIEKLDVSADSGDTLTLTLLASDCPYGGHWGYVYLDGFGAAPPPPTTTPEPDSFLLLGTGMLGLAGLMLRKVLA